MGAIRIADDEMTVFQVPVAVRVGMKPVEASGWNIAPAVKLAYVPTFGDDETDILGYQQKVLDTSPVQADIGVEARKGNFMVNVNFLAGTGKEVHVDHKVALTGFNADIGLHRARVENLLLVPQDIGFIVTEGRHIGKLHRRRNVPAGSLHGLHADTHRNRNLENRHLIIGNPDGAHFEGIGLSCERRIPRLGVTVTAPASN